jgi:hypothetical protein
MTSCNSTLDIEYLPTTMPLHCNVVLSGKPHGEGTSWSLSPELCDRIRAWATSDELRRLLSPSAPEAEACKAAAGDIYESFAVLDTEERALRTRNCGVEPYRSIRRCLFKVLTHEAH